MDVSKFVSTFGTIQNLINVTIIVCVQLGLRSHSTNANWFCFVFFRLCLSVDKNLLNLRRDHDHLHKNKYFYLKKKSGPNTRQ